MPVRCPFCSEVYEKTIGEKGSGSDLFVVIFKCGSQIDYIKGKNGRFTANNKQKCDGRSD